MQNWQFWLLFLALLGLNGQLVALNSHLGNVERETREIFSQNSMDHLEAGPGRRHQNQGRRGALAVTRTAHATVNDRESRLRRSSKRLGFELVDAEAGNNFYIRRQGSKVNETADLFGLDLTGVEAWIREQAKGA